MAIPRSGWSRRRRAVALEAAKTIAAAVLFIAAVAVAFVYIWLLAPQGAAWPS